MFTTFYASFIPVLWALTKIFSVALVAGILVRTKVIPDKIIRFLSQVTVKFLLPCLIFSKIILHFNPEDVPFWWMLPIGAVVMIGSGILISGLLFIKELPEKKNMLALAGIQNASYLVLPLGKALYPQQFDEFLVYCFLLVLGVSPVSWSIGKVLSTTGDGTPLDFKKFITPPLIANVLAITLVLTGIRNLLPHTPVLYIEKIGSITVPLATFILGATLGNISFSKIPPLKDTLRVIAVKFLILPLLTITFICLTGINDNYPLLADLLIIQSSSPAATAIILQVRAYGGDYHKMGSIMLTSYILTMFVMPFWLALWQFF